MDKQIWMGKFLSWIKSNHFIFFLLCAIIPFVVYINTLLPSVDCCDTGEFQTITYTFDIAHPTGYPTYILLGKIVNIFFKIKNSAYTMNLLSAFLVFMGILLLTLSIYKLTKNLIVSALMPLVLSFNPHLWAIAIRADPHTLHFLFTSLFIYLLIKVVQNKSYKLFVLINLVTGLAIGNQLLSVFFIPTLSLLYIYFLRKAIFSRKIIVPIISFFIGLSIYIILPIIAYYKAPLVSDYRLNTFANFLRYVSGQDFKWGMFQWNHENFLGSLNYYLTLINKSYPAYFWVLIPVGLVMGFIISPVINSSLFIIFIGTLLFAMSYQNSSIERYFLPQFTISTIWIALSINSMAKQIKKNIFVFVLYAIPIIVVFILIISNYKDIDQSKNDWASSWATTTLNSLDKNGVIFSWWSYSTPLWYMQMVEGVRPDVKIINTGSNDWERLSQDYLDARPVYFLDKIELTNSNYELVGSGEIYKMKKTSPPVLN